jgi:molybdopterin synthase catalytic subunit
MRREITITPEPIDEAALWQSRRMPPGAGAVVYFLGVVRDREGEEAIRALDYECFREMAEHQFRLLFDQIEAQGKVESVRLVHRVGPVAVNEASLWVEVTAAHRREAFDACQWLIDEMKRVVPIWKRALK